MKRSASDNKYLILENAISVTIAFMIHFPEILALTSGQDGTRLFPDMDWMDVGVEILFTYLSLLLLYFLAEKLFHFTDVRREMGWKKILCAFAVTWIASNLLGKGFVFLHRTLGIPAINATLHHYLHPLRDFLMATMVTGSNYLIYQSRKSSMMQIENQRLRAENIENQYEALKNQLNPHMLFNSLNTLSALIRESTGKAQDYLQELSSVLRFTLQDPGTHLVSLEEEMSFVRSYIYLMKVRYEDNLVFDIEVGQDALQKHVPPMSVQMLIENAVKHNEISRRKPLTVTLRADGDTLTVSNPLQPKLTADKGTKIGLDNLLKRYMLMFRKNIAIKQEDGCFTVMIPLI